MERFTRSFGEIALLLLAAKPLASAQTPLQPLVDWKDGPLLDGVGPADASSNPNDLRFWMGHGLRRGQINIGNRERRFTEELGQAGDYPTAILEMEFDEGGVGQLDDRLFVLSRREGKSTPVRKARIQMLQTLNPSTPVQLVAPDIEEDLAPAQYDYDIGAIELIPQYDLLLAVGNALPLSGTTGGPKLLMILYSYGGLGGLVKLGELRTDPLPVREIDEGEPRKLWRLLDAEVTEVGTQLLAFARGPMGETAKFTPYGLAVAKLNPTAVSPAPVIEWIPQDLSPDDPVRVFDPHYDVKRGLQQPCGSAIPGPVDFLAEQAAGLKISVNHIDFAKVTTGPAQGHYLYAACNSFNQLLEFKIDNFLDSGSGGGFGVQKKFDLTVGAPNINSQTDAYPDNLFHVTVRYVPDYPVKPVDLLYVVGQQYMHVVSRRPPALTASCGPVQIGSPIRDSLQQFFGTSATATGRVMKELADVDGPAGGDFMEREHYWVLAPETPWPWSVFDMTDRDQHPSVEPPGVLDRRYGPGGTDGALADFADVEKQSIYTTNFAGVIRYQVTPPTGTGAPTMNIVPVYDSYSPARVNTSVGNFSFGTEQLEIGDWTLPGATERDVRLYAATGQGRAVEWKVNPATARPYEAELNPTMVGLIPPIISTPQSPFTSLAADLEKQWLGSLSTCKLLSNWGQAYSLCVATGRGVETGRPYVLLDLALVKGTCAIPPATEPEDLLLLGRYWLPWQSEPGEFQVLHLTKDGDIRRDPLNQMGFDISDIEISPDGQFALVTANGGVFVVTLNFTDEVELPMGSSPAEQFARDKAWMVASTRYTEPHIVDVNLPFIDQPFSPLTITRGYREVEGAAWLGMDHVVLSMSGAGGKAALVMYAFSQQSKALGVVHTMLEDVSGDPGNPVPVDIPGTNYYVGGAVESFALSGGGHRVYATSNGNGAVVELEVLPAVNPVLAHFSTFESPTHFTETPDCRPYLWPGFGALPVILVPRYQQTLLLLRASQPGGGS